MPDPSSAGTRRGYAADAASPLREADYTSVDPNLDSLERLEAGGPMKLAAWEELSAPARLWSAVIVAAALGAILFTAVQVLL